MVWSKKKKTPQTIIFYLLNFEEKELASNSPAPVNFAHDNGTVSRVAESKVQQMLTGSFHAQATFSEQLFQNKKFAFPLILIQILIRDFKLV